MPSLDHYQYAACQFSHPGLCRRDTITKCALGLGGEAGEVQELVKKHIFHARPLPREALCKELGDVLWYLAVLADQFGLTLDEIAATNIAKLTARYPDGYSDAACAARADEATK